jgi:hypothetical protein
MGKGLRGHLITRVRVISRVIPLLQLSVHVRAHPQGPEEQFLIQPQHRVQTR